MIGWAIRPGDADPSPGPGERERERASALRAFLLTEWKKKKSFCMLEGVAPGARGVGTAHVPSPK